ncbi:MAG TPA: DUF1289 domain-containing protein [Solimonas sp.]|nr:DUF1289 domain-containing protein [Solimonas sp.]
MQPSVLQPVASPCVQVCKLDARDICIGCGRSLREIAAWSSSSREDKLRIVEHARQRRARLASGNPT